MLKSSLSAACLTLALLTTACSEKGGGETPSTTTTPSTTPTTPAAETPSAATATPDAATAETATVDAGATTPPDAGGMAVADAGATTARDAGTSGGADAGAGAAAGGKTTSKGPESIPAPKIKISKAKADVTKGEELFATKGCITCHRMGGRLVGPDLTGVLQRRPQEWVERMILKPDVMVREDEVARQLLSTYLTPMPNQGVDPDKELPFILAYLNSVK